MNKPADRIISYYIELRWKDDKPRIYVAGKPFLYCSFLVASVNVTDPKVQDMTIEDLAELPGAKQMEGIDAVEQGLLTADEVMFGFASSLEGWVRLGYNSMAIGANLAFPLLKELARAGDAKARRELGAEIDRRIALGHLGAMVAIIDTCYDVLEAGQVKAMMREPGTWLALAELEPHMPGVSRALVAHVREELRSFMQEERRSSRSKAIELQAQRLLEQIAGMNSDPSVLTSLPPVMESTHFNSPEAAEAREAFYLNLANNLASPGDLLADMAKNDREDVRANVAWNGKTPASVLAFLALDSHSLVRHHVGGNNKAPARVLETLAADSKPFVRASVASNRSTPPTALDAMFRAIEEQIHQLSKSSEHAMRYLVSETEAAVLQGIAENPKTPPSTLGRMARLDDIKTLTYVAENPSTPPVVLAGLAEHQSEHVRRSIARNPHVPLDILKKLAKEYGEVRYAALQTLARQQGE